MLPYAGIVPVLLLFEFTLAQNVPLRGPPQFEMNPQYLDSYIPASIQVIAYLTEMMKYDIKPTVTTTTTHRPTTTTRPTNRPIIIQLTTKRPLFTAPPTPYHKPALYAPYHPPGFIISRFKSPLVGDLLKVDSYEEYVNRLKHPLAHYFDRYRQKESISSIIDQLNRQRRATPFSYTTDPTEKSTKNYAPNARRSSRSSGDLILSRAIRKQPTEKKPELSRSRSIRSVFEEAEESSSPILQRKIRASPFIPVKANANVVRQRNGQEFRSIQNSRQQPTEKKPELSRSRSIRSVFEEAEESSSPILQRKIRASPFIPVKANANVVRQKNGQEFRSIQNSRQQPTEKKPELSRSRSIRSVPIDETTISIGGLNSPSEDISVGKVPLIMTDLKKAPLQVTVSSDNKAKGRALSINGANSFNARSVDYLSLGLNEFIKEIQSERENIENRLTDDDRVQVFSTKYDDVNFGSYLLRQKKIPPTKAYVTLLSLYDLLNKESKKLILNKYNGYATAIVEELIDISSGTSSEQLRTILQRIIDRPDTYDPTIRSKITSLVTDLSTSNSYINDALRYIPPLPFTR